MTQFEQSLQDLGNKCQEYYKLVTTGNAVTFYNIFEFQKLQQDIIDKAMIFCIDPKWKDKLVGGVNDYSTKEGK